MAFSPDLTDENTEAQGPKRFLQRPRPSDRLRLGRKANPGINPFLYLLQMDRAANPNAYRNQADNKPEQSRREFGAQRAVLGTETNCRLHSPILSRQPPFG